MDWGEILVDASVAAIGPIAAAYALAAVGLNLQFGYTGLLNFGHVAFMMCGASIAPTITAGAIANPNHRISRVSSSQK